VRSVKEECLNRVLLLGERHLRRSLAEFVVHYHAERNHHGIGKELEPIGYVPPGNTRRATSKLIEPILGTAERRTSSESDVAVRRLQAVNAASSLLRN
jgi:hypothetical protein